MFSNVKLCIKYPNKDHIICFFLIIQAILAVFLSRFLLKKYLLMSIGLFAIRVFLLILIFLFCWCLLYVWIFCFYCKFHFRCFCLRFRSILRNIFPFVEYLLYFFFLLHIICLKIYIFSYSVDSQMPHLFL